MHLDEGFDRAIRVPTGGHGQDREQQDIRLLIELAFGPARVRDLTEYADQPIERSQGNLLADWLPCIDSEISPRRNRQSACLDEFIPGVAARTQPLWPVVLSVEQPWVILDRMLPGGIDGLRILETLRAQKNAVPV